MASELSSRSASAWATGCRAILPISGNGAWIGPVTSCSDLLAVIAAGAVNAVQRKEDRPGCARLKHAADLAMALKLDVRRWFTPTADGYFSRVSRAQILADIDEAKGEHAPALGEAQEVRACLPRRRPRGRYALAAAGYAHRGQWEHRA